MLLNSLRKFNTAAAFIVEKMSAIKVKRASVLKNVHINKSCSSGDYINDVPTSNLVKSCLD